MADTNVESCGHNLWRHCWLATKRTIKQTSDLPQEVSVGVFTTTAPGMVSRYHLLVAPLPCNLQRPVIRLEWYDAVLVDMFKCLACGSSLVLEWLLCTCYCLSSNAVAARQLLPRGY